MSDSDSDSDISLDLNKDDSDDEYNSETEMITGMLDAKKANLKGKPVAISIPVVIPVIRDLFGENEEILEDVNIDPGTYQGGKKDAKDIENKKLNEKKRAQMKRDQRILNNSVDILSHLNSDAESPHVHQTTRPARRGRISAAGRRLIDNPPPDVATTPKKPRGKIQL